MPVKPIVEGAATAIVTPLDENGVNYEQLGKLIDWQIESGIDALVVISQKNTERLHCGKLNKVLHFLKRADADAKFHRKFSLAFYTNNKISCIIGKDALGHILIS